MINNMSTERIGRIYKHGFNDALVEFRNFVDSVDVIDRQEDAYDVGFSQAVKTIKEGLQKIMLDAEHPC